MGDQAEGKPRKRLRNASVGERCGKCEGVLDETTNHRVW